MADSGVGLVWLGQSSAKNEGSGVLQLLSTVWESGEDSLISRKGTAEGGGVGGGDDEGGSTLVEEEEEEEEQGAEPAWPMWGLAALLTSPEADGGSKEAPSQASDAP